MTWDDQELNLKTESQFPEIILACHALFSRAARDRGKFLRVDQQALDQMVAEGRLIPRPRSPQIGRVCLYCRLMCRLGPGGDHYPVIGVLHFWLESESLYAIAHIAAKNDWIDVMVVAGEAPNHGVDRTATATVLARAVAFMTLLFARLRLWVGGGRVPLTLRGGARVGKPQTP